MPPRHPSYLVNPRSDPMTPVFDVVDRRIGSGRFAPMRKPAPILHHPRASPL